LNGGQGYKAFGDNINNPKFLLVMFMIVFLTIIFKYAINMLYYEFLPSEVEKILA
jgi:hypothetical protein